MKKYEYAVMKGECIDYCDDGTGWALLLPCYDSSKVTSEEIAEAAKIYKMTFRARIAEGLSREKPVRICRREVGEWETVKEVVK